MPDFNGNLDLYLDAQSGYYEEPNEPIMKFTVTFKTPDAVHYATEDMDEDQRAEAQRVASLFVKYGEVVRIEFDTDKETATVLR